MVLEYEDLPGATASVKYTKEFENYNPSAIGDEFTDGDADVPSYESFEEAFQEIGKFIKSLFGSVDDVKTEAKTEEVTIPSAPSTTEVAAKQTRVLVKNKKAQAEFLEAGIAADLYMTDGGADPNAGEHLPGAVAAAWKDPDKEKDQKARMLANGTGAAAAKIRDKNETPEEALDEEFALGFLALAAGGTVNASGVLNLIVNAVGKIIHRSQNVTQSTKHPKPERSFVSQQNAQQQQQNQLAFAAFSTAISLATGKSFSTPLSGLFAATSVAGMTGSFQPDQGIEYVYPEEDYEYGGVKWVKEKGPDGNDQLKTNIGTTIPA